MSTMVKNSLIQEAVSVVELFEALDRGEGDHGETARAVAALRSELAAEGYLPEG